MPQINCFKNYITLRGVCTEVTPISGKYFNDLAGVDLKGLSNLSTEEQVSFQGVYDEIYTRSINELESDVQIKMQKYFKSNMLIENITTGGNITYEVETSSNEKKGVAIEALGSKNMKLYINNVDLYTTSAITDAIRIYDYNTGVLLDTIAFTSVANTFNRIEINKSYGIESNKRKIFISYNGNLTASIKTEVAPYYENSSYYPIVRAAELLNSASIIESNLTFGTNTCGLIANFNVICSIENFICSNRDFLAMPLMYKLGENYMLERLTTRVLSEDSIFDVEGTEKLRIYYKDKYDASLDSILNSISPQGDEICFPCDKKRTYKYMKP
jgi:hypothetical protein